jgi:hypothetical protein
VPFNELAKAFAIPLIEIKAEKLSDNSQFSLYRYHVIDQGSVPFIIQANHSERSERKLTKK